MRETTQMIDEATVQLIDAVWAGWQPGGDRFETCVADVVERHGYVADDVRLQLGDISRACSSAALSTLTRAEGYGSTVRPERTLVLAAAGVPGVAVDAVCCALFLGAQVQVRPSRAEVVLPHWAAHVEAVAPELASRLELIDAIDHAWPDSAVIYGHNETIEAVRQQLAASCVIAGYGTRTGVAIIGGSAGVGDGDGGRAWITALADDVMTFAQRGCMSPQHLFAVGSSARIDAIADLLEPALVAAYERHVTPAQRERDRYAARSGSDETFFGQAFEPVRRVTSTGVPSYSRTVASPTGRPELAVTVTQLVDGELVGSDPSTRQTCVIIAAEEHERAELTELAYHDAGFTRVCTPGSAHHPSPMWTHDGVGRIAPLCRRPG